MDVLIGKVLTPAAIAILISIAASTDKLAGRGTDAATELRGCDVDFF